MRRGVTMAAPSLSMRRHRLAARVAADTLPNEWGQPFARQLPGILIENERRENGSKIFKLQIPTCLYPGNAPPGVTSHLFGEDSAQPRIRIHPRLWTWGSRAAGATSRPQPPSLPPPGPGAARPAPPASLWTSPPRGGWRWGGVWPWPRRASPWGGAGWPPLWRRTRCRMRPAARPAAPWYHRKWEKGKWVKDLQIANSYVLVSWQSASWRYEAFFLGRFRTAQNPEPTQDVNLRI